MKQNIKNEYDEAKKMLNVLRNLNARYENRMSLKEDENEEDQYTDTRNQKNDIAIVDDVEIQINSSDESDLELDKETTDAISQMLTNLKSTVSQIIEFEPGMTINEEEIRLDGTITEKDISFVYIAGGETQGAYVNANMLVLDKEVILLLGKVEEFFQTYVDSMNPLIIKRKNNLPIKQNNNS